MTEQQSALQQNILAAKHVALLLKTTLGPKGMDKMLVNSKGEVTMTNDGVTILNKMKLEHPAGKILVEVANTQERELGDGTTTAVVLAGALIEEAESLLSKGIHPSTVIKGYRSALNYALGYLGDCAVECDEEQLKSVAETAMVGKGPEESKSLLASLILSGLDGCEKKSDLKITSVVGNAISDSKLIEGIVLDKEPIHSSMSNIAKGKIALVDDALEIPATESSANLNLTDPSQLQALMSMETKMLKDKVQSLISRGVNIAVFSRGVDDRVHQVLAKSKVLVIRRVHKSDLLALAKLTGASISSLSELSKEDLGEVSVTPMRSNNRDLLVFKGTNKSSTLILSAATPQVLDEVERAVTDAIGDVWSVKESGKVIGGGGTFELRCAHYLRQEAIKVKGKEQVVVKAFADALEHIPMALIESAGLDPLSLLSELHGSEDFWSCLNVNTGLIENPFNVGLVEPTELKSRALINSVESACMILKVDDIVVVKD